jgi:hypothetical protein
VRRAVGIESFAEREQLQKLARIVLVRVAGHAQSEIEVDEHPGIGRHPAKQVGDVAERAAAMELVLLIEVLGNVDDIELAGKMIVPEEGHLLTKTDGIVEHLRQPPLLQ